MAAEPLCGVLYLAGATEAGRAQRRRHYPLQQAAAGRSAVDCNSFHRPPVGRRQLHASDRKRLEQSRAHLPACRPTNLPGPGAAGNSRTENPDRQSVTRPGADGRQTTPQYSALGHPTPGTHNESFGRCAARHPPVTIVKPFGGDTVPGCGEPSWLVRRTVFSKPALVAASRILMTVAYDARASALM